MKFHFLIFSIIIPVIGLCQPKIGPDNVITSPSNPGSGVIDGVYRKSDIISKRQPVAYEHVREADYVWGKRTWSYIDLREKINHSLYFPTEKYLASKATGETNEISLAAQGRYSLYYILSKSIQDKTVTAFYADRPVAYDPDTGDEIPAIKGGDSFKFPLNTSSNSFEDDLMQMLGTVNYSGNDIIYDPNDNECFLRDDVDASIRDAALIEGAYKLTVLKTANPGKDAYIKFADILTTDESQALKFAYDPQNPNVKDGIKPRYRIMEKSYFKPEQITKWHLKEDWFFDKETSKFKVRIIGIAPVAYKTIKDTVLTINAEGVRVAKEIEAQVEQELFWMYFPHVRQVLKNFYCYNPKTDAQWMSYDDLFWKRKFTSVIYKESSLFDRKIEQYRFGLDALYESKRIKDDMRNLEHDFWNF